MLKSLYSQHILRDPATLETGGGGDTIVTAPAASAPAAPVTSTKKSPNTPTPDILKGTFSTADIEIEQLPGIGSLGDDEPDDGIKLPKQKQAAAKKEEPTAPVVPKKEEPAKVEPTAAPAVLKAPAAPVTGKEVIKPVQIPGAGVRDYSKYTAEEQAVLKQMSNPAFEFASKLLEEKKSLEKGKDNLYLQHDDAYMLDPQFKSKQTDLSFAQKEASYWESQLVSMSQGKPWRPILQWDDKGNPVLGPERQPTKADEIRVNAAYQNCVNASSNLTSELQTYPSKYKEQVKQDLAAFDSEQKARFSWEQDPKLLDYTINIEGLGDRSIKQIREDIISVLPPYMRQHPLARAVGNLMAALRIGYAEMAVLRQGQQVQQVQAQEASAAEPNPQGKPAPTAKGKEVHGVTEFRLDDFPS